MTEHPEISTTPMRDIGLGGELHAVIDDARWRYDKVMEAVTGADLKASIIATVQAAALGALLTTTPAGKLTAPSRVLFVAGVGALLVGVATAGTAIFPGMGCAAHHRSATPGTSLISNSGGLTSWRSTWPARPSPSS